jgi:hypothetical protein
MVSTGHCLPFSAYEGGETPVKSCAQRTNYQ